MKKENLILIICGIVAVILIIIILFLIFGGKKEFVVGKDIEKEEINEFYYTYATTTNPPEYLRYHFFIHEDKYKLFYELRKGDHLPLLEKDAVESKVIELSDDEWTSLYNYLENGIVTKRKEDTETGNSLSLFLYWKDDGSKYQEYNFENGNTRIQFEEFCASLIK